MSIDQASASYDVIQVGYGPVSQVLALMLGRLGYKVAIAERWTEPYNLPRAVCIDHEAARILRAIGLGEGLARVIQPAPTYQWFNADWEELLSIDWSAESVSGGPEVNFVHQPSLEAEFRAQVLRHANIDVLLGWEFIGQTDCGDDVEITLRAAQGNATKTLHARFLVGVYGANSAMRESLAIGREDRGFEADWLIADMKLNPGVKLDIPDCGQYCNPARPTTIVPGGQQDGRLFRRWEFMRLPHETREAMQEQAYVWNLLSAWVRPDQAELVRHAIYTFRSLVADTWCRGRVLLAGDAAHVMPPFMGQDMCAGIRDAWNLSWKLDFILRGLADTTLLDSYTDERKPHGIVVIDASIYLGRVICIADPAEAALRDRAFKDGSADPPPPFPHLTAGLLARDRLGGVLAPAGLLSPQGMVRWRGREGRWDDVVGTGFCVMLLEIDPARLLGPDQLASLAAMEAKLTGISAQSDSQLMIDVDGKYTAFCKQHGVAGIIVRPDFYIFSGVTSTSDVPDAVHALLGALVENGMHAARNGEATFRQSASMPRAGNLLTQRTG